MTGEALIQFLRCTKDGGTFVRKDDRLVCTTCDQGHPIIDDIVRFVAVLSGLAQENMTRGTGIKSHVFDEYAPLKGDLPSRHNGVLISNEDGEAVAYSLFTLQERGRLFVEHGTKVYEGMIIGIHSRDNDLVVNPIREKKLTNIRAAGKDDALLLTPPIELTLEYAVEFINDDEIVEVTPESIRLRKRFLKETDRKRAERAADAAVGE